MIGSPSILDLRKAFDAFHLVDDAAWAHFAPLIERVILERDQYFVRAGAHCGYIGFIESGLLRAYYPTQKGDEVTTNFCGDGSIVSAYSSVLTDRPSSASIQALESTTMLRFDASRFRLMFETFPAWNHVGRRMVEAYYIFQEQRIADLMTLNAKARYEKFRLTHAAIAPRLQRQQIAAYLGITRVALSRLGRSRK